MFATFPLACEPGQYFGRDRNAEKFANVQIYLTSDLPNIDDTVDSKLVTSLIQFLSIARDLCTEMSINQKEDLFRAMVILRKETSEALRVMMKLDLWMLTDQPINLNPFKPAYGLSLEMKKFIAKGRKATKIVIEEPVTDCAFEVYDAMIKFALTTLDRFFRGHRNLLLDAKRQLAPHNKLAADFMALDHYLALAQESFKVMRSTMSLERLFLVHRHQGHTASLQRDITNTIGRATRRAVQVDTLSWTLKFWVLSPTVFVVNPNNTRFQTPPVSYLFFFLASRIQNNRHRYPVLQFNLANDVPIEIQILQTPLTCPSVNFKRELI